MTARINQEAMDEILLRWNWGRMDELRELLKPMLSITGPEPNKWQPKTRGGYDFEIFAERDGVFYGRAGIPSDNFWLPCDWRKNGNGVHAQWECWLIPANPHAELIARLRNIPHLNPEISDALVITEALQRDLLTALDAAGGKP